ncbi:MAG: hypothetical protein JWM37_863 [Candidatus Saccharibacteria bacterium]|nr:hypothetical protein [Candidatus Saccharibacteria bacterium]
MLDRVISHYSAIRHGAVVSDYSPQQAITSKTIFNAGGEYLTVLLPPWHGGGAVYDRLIKRLVKNGSAVVSYKFHGQILSADIQQVVDSFHYIQETIAADINDLLRTGHYRHVDVIASSLGNVSLCLVANMFQEFNRVTMIVPGANLATCTWDGSRTKLIRKELEKQGITKHDLEDAWSSLAPIHNLSGLKDSEVRVYMSKSDLIIPTRYQMLLAVSLKADIRSCSLEESTNGHVATIANFCIRGPIG